MRSPGRSSGVAGGQVAGCFCRSPRFIKPGLWISLRRERTRQAHPPAGGAARAGLPDAEAPIAARQPGVREILEA
jgi:hypothetical protein